MDIGPDEAGERGQDSRAYGHARANQKVAHSAPEGGQVPTEDREHQRSEDEVLPIGLEEGPGEKAPRLPLQHQGWRQRCETEERKARPRREGEKRASKDHEHDEDQGGHRKGLPQEAHGAI